MKNKVWRSLFFTLFLFGLLGWIYIAVNAEVHPWTLPLPLTHLAPWPREDTFGAACFLVSMISFFIWNILRNDRRGE